MYPIGCHSTYGHRQFLRDIQIAQSYGANVVQLYMKHTGNPIIKLTNEEIDSISAILKNIMLFTHSSYYINLASEPNSHTARVSRVNLWNDLENMRKVGGQGVIVHMGRYPVGKKGKHRVTAETIRIGTMHMLENIRHLTVKMSESMPAIILETSAGVGAELHSDFRDFFEFYMATLVKTSKAKASKTSKTSKTQKLSVKICIDTAHLHSSGTPFRTVQDVDRIFEHIRQFFPNLECLACVHFNDSKKPADSHLDMHENIGKGYVPPDVLRRVLWWTKKYRIPIILETPTANNMNAIEIEKIKEYYDSITSTKK